ncbi:MAG: amidohydrolase family protein [Chitinophagaceae bacterium]|nr:amidohydrolase family protein [Chitinophagaceae bacterium]
MQRIVDTHIHVWDLSRADYPWLKGDATILNRSYKLDEIDEERKVAGVTHGVMVQASCNLDDTNMMLEVAEQNDWIRGVVCWLPLADTSRAAKLLDHCFLPHEYFKGVRHLIHDEQDPRWLLQHSVIESLKLLAENDIPYDVVGVLPAHIETVLEVATQVPDLRMIFDHLNAPPISTRERFGKWGSLMKEAANNKNIFAKISGLGTASGNFSGRTVEDIKPYVAFALEHFGTERCLCGGDWPVSALVNTYADTWMITKNIVSELVNETEQEAIYYRNADKFYDLGLDH